ncbi:MAG: hypothetical protein HY314_04075 [Acidobacteria bacterium]|nr:hypothetical protein [Acidobacteriota bacterium]
MRRSNSWRLLTGWLIGIIGIMFLVTTAFAQERTEEKPLPSQPNKVEEEIERFRALIQRQQQQLEQQQRQLDEQAALLRQLQQQLVERQPALAPVQNERHKSEEAPKTPAQQRPSGEDRLQAGWADGHPFIRSGDGELEARFTGYTQLDFRGYGAGNTPPNTFAIRRARLAVEGTLFRHYEFKLEGDFADTASTMLREGFININYAPEVQFRFGQFKAPFSQEELISSSSIDFVERSMVNNLVHSYTPGMQFHGKVADGRIEYQLAAVNGKGILATNTSSTSEGVVRLRFNPWKQTDHFWLRGLKFGGALSDGRTSNGRSFRGRTESRSFVFFEPAPINGEVLRANGELTWLLGPGAIRAEYVQTNQARDGLGPGRINLPGVVAKGYMIQGTYLLTGESKPESGLVKPKSVFAGRGDEPGTGAWELKFRYANLQLSDSFLSNRAETFSAGINWYLTPYVRYMLDLNVERFKDPLRSPMPQNPGALFTWLTRVQFYF